MDAVKFLEEWHRMCKSNYSVSGCGKCPMSSLNGFCAHNISMPVEDVVSRIEKWSAEHPVKTRLMDFMEKHPNARLQPGTRMPFLTPDVLGYCGTSVCKSCEHERYTMAHCWNLPLEE